MKFFLTAVVGLILLSIFFIPNVYFTQLFTDKESTTSAIGNLLTIITFLAGFILVILPMKIDASRQKKTVQTRLHTYLIKRNRFLTVLFFLFLIEMVLLAMLLFSMQFWVLKVAFFLLGILVNSRVNAVYTVLGALLPIPVALLAGVESAVLNAGLMGYNGVLCAIALGDKTWSGGVYAVFSVLLSVFLQLLGMDVGITTLTAPFVFSVWITVGIRYMLLTLFPAKRKVA